MGKAVDMQKKPILWQISVSCAPVIAENMADVMAETSLAVSVVMPPRQKRARIEAIFDGPQDVQNIEDQLAALGEYSDFKQEQIPDIDWLGKVAADNPPVTIGRWMVHAPDQKPKHHKNLHTLSIRSSNAFGSGAHPTTSGCLLLLESLLKRGVRLQRIADIGCGSGILSLAFLNSRRRGLAVAIDNDATSVAMTNLNASANGLRQRIRASRNFGLRDSSLKRHAPYDLVMANIFARPVRLLAKDIRPVLAYGGYVILSGMLTTQANSVIEAYRIQGFHLIKHLRRDEWSTLAFRHGSRA